MTDPATRVRILAEALPYIRDYRGAHVVVKAGGQVLVDPELRRMFARDVSLLAMVGVRLVVVHGGGPQINRRLAEAGIPENKVDGLRITDAATMKVVAAVLCDEINADLVADIRAAGAAARGISGADGLLQASPAAGGAYGLVGEVNEVNLDVLDLPAGEVPVIAPVGAGAGGDMLNINADVAAAALAAALQARALLLLTDTDGVLDAAGNVVAELGRQAVQGLIDDGSITAGMRPKVECALQALAGGVGSCRIINGTATHPLLMELLTEGGVGTMITTDE